MEATRQPPTCATAPRFEWRPSFVTPRTPSDTPRFHTHLLSSSTPAVKHRRLKRPIPGRRSQRIMQNDVRCAIYVKFCSPSSSPMLAFSSLSYPSCHPYFIILESPRPASYSPLLTPLFSVTPRAPSLFFSRPSLTFTSTYIPALSVSPCRYRRPRRPQLLHY